MDEATLEEFYKTNLYLSNYYIKEAIKSLDIISEIAKKGKNLCVFIKLLSMQNYEQN